MMEVIEIKRNKIIDRISEINDIELLDQLEHLIEDVNIDEKVHQLTDNQRSFIEESMAQYKRGEFSSNEEVFSKIEKWLEK